MTNYKCIDLTTNGQCSRCGSCCSNFLPMTNNEKKRLQRLVKEHKAEVQIKKFQGKLYMACPFLIMNNENNITKCSVYKDRPLICRVFKCNKKPQPLSVKMNLVDVMKDIVHYDYQKDAGMSYEECLKEHLERSFK